MDLRNNLPLSELVEFSTNQNAAKLEFSIQSSSATLQYLFIGEWGDC